ncbi:molybdopterin converting factor, small subunit [Desulfocurvibacter africanus PCS]|uniref:Molybdopterin converting factor, small subunit n=1 Tax=Desulfocurvibacter africanus PCS TaxID=1262666 RepID=M5PP16_DESAF|nr:MoaD/ThiS family protein [Desulfocurvibacter africanus]EMG35645.1 molybdopterin converting factor, small subunit [Desulfocurvibacter africanus PCS]
MHIELKCFATLSRYTPPGAERYELPDGATVGEIMTRLGLAQEDVKLIFVNGVKAELDTRLKDCDRLGLFPAVGGG